MSLLNIESPDHLLSVVREDRDHGATELALLAINGIAALCDLPQSDSPQQVKQAILTIILELRSCRPSMAPLDNLLTLLGEKIAELKAKDINSLQVDITQACAQVVSHTRRAQQSAVRNMAALVGAGDTIMSHSVSSTVKQLARHLVESGINTRWVITESRPGNEGKLLAAFLADLGISITYITEAQIDMLMPEVNKVIVGADSILLDGSVINKSGTTLMALSARHRGVPLYVCAESFKQTQSNEFELEEMDPAELGLEVPRVEVRNVYFERVSKQLIHKWVQ